MEHNENGFLKYVDSNRRTRDSIGPLLDNDNHNTNRYIGKTEIFNAFFSSVFNNNDEVWDILSPELENHDWDNNNLPANSIPVQNFLLHLHIWSPVALPDEQDVWEADQVPWFAQPREE